jgi:hypothetical protein
MRALAFISTLALAGCLNGEYNNNDASARVPDMATPRMYDLAGIDLYGAYNCTQLNACEKACTTAACVYMCRNKAAPPAVDKELALQMCFTMFCPNGMGQVCAPDANGMLSATCNACVANTYIPNNQSCSPSQMPSECHQCVAQANACTSDV